MSQIENAQEVVADISFAAGHEVDLVEAIFANELDIDFVENEPDAEGHDIEVGDVGHATIDGHNVKCKVVAILPNHQIQVHVDGEPADKTHTISAKEFHDETVHAH